MYCSKKSKLKLEIMKFLPGEICHYAAPGRLITSHYRSVNLYSGGTLSRIDLPASGSERFAGTLLRPGWSRLARRALRLDKCNVVPVGDNLVIIRQGKVYHYQLVSGRLIPTLTLRNCRNVLHQSVLVLGDSTVYFGEYGNNPNRESVPVYRSLDGGASWEEIYTFPAGKVKHVHGCYWDPVEEKIWVFTGDFAGECYILCADRDFQSVEWIGDGGQVYRACSAFFEADTVHWIMDSQLEPSHHVALDRRTRKIIKKTGADGASAFPGPVWYIKRLADGYYLAATAQEIGPGVLDDYAHLVVSRDLENWAELHRFEHDGLPKRYFKFGVIGFAGGEQSSEKFYLFFEALKGVDGRIAECRIVE
jgi:hypothetical protein